MEVRSNRITLYRNPLTDTAHGATGPTTYVVGAGASRHAGYPLSAELGRDLLAWSLKSKQRDAVKTAQSLCGRFGNEWDLGYIATELEKAKEYNLLYWLQSRTCDYFSQIQRIAQPAPPLYERLASEQILAGDTVITFNYDASLERALKRSSRWEIGDGYNFSVGRDLPGNSQVKVLKPHGSVNWWGADWGGRQPLGPNPVICFPYDFEYLGYDRPGGPHIITILDAAIVLPTPDKRFYLETSLGPAWEQFWDYLWHQTARALQSSTRIVVVGYSLPHDDRRAIDKLKLGNRQARVEIVCGSDSNRIARAFRSWGFNDVHSCGLFEDWLDSDLAR